jgi:hypothetical protein
LLVEKSEQNYFLLANQKDRMLSSARICHQRGEASMTQGLLPFQYEIEKTEGVRLPALAGLAQYVELDYSMGLWRTISKRMRGRRVDQGWTDE